MTPPSPPPDPLDAQLRAFFRQQMPAPWPDCPVPSERAAPRRAADWRDGANAGRLLLAASVAALVGVGLSLPKPAAGPRAVARPASPPTARTLLQDATADGANLLELATPMTP